MFWLVGYVVMAVIVCFATLVALEKDSPRNPATVPCAVFCGVAWPIGIWFTIGFLWSEGL